MYKILLTIFGMCYCCSASAQLNWRSKGPLYHDKNISVEIEYAIDDGPCEAGGGAQYRYKITRLKTDRAFFINWRFDYFNCDHEIKTHANSLHVTTKTKTGYFTPEDNRFPAMRLVNNFNDVRRANNLPPVSGYQPMSTTSLEPRAIAGNLIISLGDTTRLTLTGGYLAGNAVWKWYANSCNGSSIGSGRSIKVQPAQTTTYFVRAEGKDVTLCVPVTVTVSDVSLAAKIIEGKTQICAGEKNVRLTAIGGKLAAGGKWIWYADSCEGKAIGEGASINVSPARTTLYYVRAESPGSNTACLVHQLTVGERSTAAGRIGGGERVALGESFTLTVYGGELARDAKWVWYNGPADHKRPVGTGSSVTVDRLYTDQSYYVRAEGVCYTSEFIGKTVKISHTKPAVKTDVKTHGSNMFFLNGGIVASDAHLNGISNYVVTIGGGKNIGWFIRAKISGDQSAAAYESADVQINNYSQPGYYEYNTKIVNKRAAYTGGIYLGGRNVAIYIGGGYGTRELLYGIDQYSYGNSVSTASAFVKNTAYSYSGAEIEGGLMVKIGFFNVMGGASTISGKYTDYNLGIGFNF